MTFSTANNKATYTGNGVTVAFSFPYLFKDSDHLKVYIDGDLSGSGYTITGAGNPSGGTVTFSVAPANGVSVVLLRQVPYVQETDIVDFDGNPAQVTEDQFDLCVMMASQLSEVGDRTITVPVDVTLSSNEVSGTIDSTVRLMAISTSGPSAVELSDVSTTLDTIITSPVAGEVLTWDGTHWVNDSVPQFTVATSNIDMAFVYKLENMANPFNPQDAATKDYVDGLIPPILRNNIDGFTLSTAGSSATMSIAAGQCTDSTNAVYITLASSINKTTSAWAVGSGNGGLDTGTIAINTWYYFFAIYRSDTGVEDVLISLSKTSPTLPSGYTHYRYIGSGRTNASSQWTKVFQDGDTFMYDVPVLDINATNAGTAAVDRTLSVPPSSTAIIVSSCFNGTTNSWFSLVTSKAQTDTTPSSSAFNASAAGGTTAAHSTTGYLYVKADASSVVRSRQSASGAADNIRIQTFGWIDTRGKE